MSYNAAVSAKVIDLLRNHITGHPAEPSQSKELLATLGKDIDRAIIEEKSTYILQHLYDTVLWYISEVQPSTNPQ